MADALRLEVSALTDPVPETERLLAAREGDRDAFDQLMQPIRGRLRAHCYHMLGTIDDADDAVQETLLRAWRHLSGFEPKTSVLAWLYRIATNVCLTVLHRRSARGPDAELPLDPYPDLVWPNVDQGDPSAAAERRETVQLAFTETVLKLPARQRSVLLLHDVLGFSSAEVATMVATTVVAVNSALQRARATLREPSREPLAREHIPADRRSERSLVRRFVAAWENADVDGLVELLTDDAVLAMPPEPERFAGPDAISRFLRKGPLKDPGWFLLLPTRANGQPAMATYLRSSSEEAFHAHALMVLSLRGDAVASVTRFGGARLVEHFGFPSSVKERPADR